MSHNRGLEPPIRALIDRYKPAWILDVACGHGEWFHQRPLAEWVGIDIWLPYIKCIEYIEPVHGTVTHLPFQGCSFDLVLCIEVLEHLAPRDGLLMLEEAKRVTRKAVIVTTPTDALGRHNQDVLEENPHERHITQVPAAQLIEAGFQVHDVKTSDPKWDEFTIGVYEKANLND